MPQPSFHWLDVQRIAEELADAHPDLRPFDVNFVELKKLVTALPGFSEREGHPCNERILEAIQAHWAGEVDEDEA